MEKQRKRELLRLVGRFSLALLAMAAGSVVGLAVMLAIVVAKARAGLYTYALDDLMAIRLETAPMLIGPLAGLILGWRHPESLDRAMRWGFSGMLIGAVIGVGAGSLVWRDTGGPWAGAILGGAFGLLISEVASFVRGRHHWRPPLGGVLGSGLLVTSALLGVFGATNFIDLEPLNFPAFDAVPVPEASNVDAVLFLLGDAGSAVWERTPLLHAMRRDVASWSAAVARDSAVSVVFLGDLVYPEGVHDRDHPQFETDSVRLWNQIDIVADSNATKHATLGLFVTGNHDWANTRGEVGYQRVKNLGELLGHASTRGHFVRLLPPAGEPGPITRDLRRNVRLVFIDTHWFLQQRLEREREGFFQRLEIALHEAGDHEVIMIAHHPYYSAGPHAAVLPGSQVNGVAFLLKKSGALVQDLNSPAYAGFLARLHRIFETSAKPPLIFAAGHDHSLQVLTADSDFDPRFILVSGAGSKLSAIEMTARLRWGTPEPGYMMLVFRKDEGVDLFVVAADRQFLECTGSEEQVAKCMSDGVNAFKIVYSAVLLAPPPVALSPPRGRGP